MEKKQGLNLNRNDVNCQIKKIIVNRKIIDEVILRRHLVGSHFTLQHHLLNFFMLEIKEELSAPH